MSNSNPTALRIGATGMLDGRRYTVAGRTVLSVVVEGETYCWNEFNLVDASDNALTLVYEDTEDGPEWKLFKLFEPLRPLSASEAAMKRTGDWIDFGVARARITLVDRSRIVAVEGRVPEGVAIGVEANYFNAEYGNRMIVVSWSGEEVECYEGGVTPARRIEAAFGLPRTEPQGRTFLSGAGGKINYSSRVLIAAVTIAIALIGFLVRSAQPNSEAPFSRPVPPKRSASPSPLQVGAAGTLVGENFRVTAYALVEISRLGDRFDGHEYALATPTDGHALLVEALQGKSTDWYLLTPGVTPADLTPYVAASFRQGRPAIIGGRSVQIEQLFQFRAMPQAGDDSTLWWPAGIGYGFLAKKDGVGAGGDEWMVVRWTETGIASYRVKIISDSDLKRGFGGGKK